jgi:hypothetical protein
MITATGRRLAAVAAVFTMTGCAGTGLGVLEEVLGTVLGQPAGGGQGQVAVEIQGVDARQQVIQVATQEGQTGNVRYDQNTVVVYRQQQYPVTALERGDLAVITIQDVQGTTYVSRVEVQQSVRERTGAGTGTGSVVQLSGRVAQINHNAGTFVLQTPSGNITVSLPFNAPQATVNYFHQLRNGTDVRLEATMLATGRAEIHRFL